MLYPWVSIAPTAPPETVSVRLALRLMLLAPAWRAPPEKTSGAAAAPSEPSPAIRSAPPAMVVGPL